MIEFMTGSIIKKMSFKEWQVLSLKAIKIAKQDDCPCGCGGVHCYPIKKIDNKNCLQIESVINGNFLNKEYDKKNKQGFVSVNGISVNG